MKKNKPIKKKKKTASEIRGKISLRGMSWNLEKKDFPGESLDNKSKSYQSLD